MRIVVTVKQIIVKSATINIETELMDTGNIGNIKKDILQKYNNGELDEQLEVDEPGRTHLNFFSSLRSSKTPP